MDFTDMGSSTFSGGCECNNTYFTDDPTVFERRTCPLHPWRTEQEFSEPRRTILILRTLLMILEAQQMGTSQLSIAQELRDEIELMERGTKGGE